MGRGGLMIRPEFGRCLMMDSLQHIEQLVNQSYKDIALSGDEDLDIILDRLNQADTRLGSVTYELRQIKKGGNGYSW